jgi:hypothetical protein
MRDIELVAVPSVPADPDVDDAAYGSTEGAGLIASDTTLVDPAFTDTKAYGRPSLGGDFGVGRAAILGADADGGAADLAVDTTIIVTPPVVPTPPNPMALGRSANNTSRENLFPWFKVPPEGLDMNNPNPPPAPPGPPPIPPGVVVSVGPLIGNQGTAVFSGPAQRNATVTLDYSINGGPMQQVVIMILIGDTASQVAAKVRNAIDAVFGLDASGTGGTVNIVGLGGTLTAYNITIT